MQSQAALNMYVKYSKSICIDLYLSYTTDFSRSTPTWSQ